MKPTKICVMLKGYDWEEVPLTKAQNVAGLKTEIKRVWAPEILTDERLKLFYSYDLKRINGELSNQEYYKLLDNLCENVKISLKGVYFKTVLKADSYDEKEYLDKLEKAAMPLKPQASLLDVLKAFNVDRVDQIANNKDTVREKFAENIWTFVYLRQAASQDVIRADKENKKEELDDDHIILTAGPLRPAAGWLMYPFLDWDAFKKPINQFFHGASYIFHGPYQSGKSSLLLSVEVELQRQKKLHVFLDAFALKGSIEDYGSKDGFIRYLSTRLFRKALVREELYEEISRLEEHLYILFDEFQFIFTNEELLETAKDFFKFLSNKSASYIAVGTFKLVELMNDSNSPFNKANFIRMPFLGSAQMIHLFDQYKAFIDLNGVPEELQSRIMAGSSGHPASFMIMLKFYNQCRPTVGTWSAELQSQLEIYLNGTHVSIKRQLTAMGQEDQAYVRSLMDNMDYWDVDIENLGDVDKKLLEIGIITLSTDKRKVRFTSDIILRVCISSLWPQPMVKITENEVSHPINLLACTLQYLDPNTIIHDLARNKNGLSEPSIQAAIFRAMNGLLPYPYLCLFEVKAKKKEEADLAVTKNKEKLHIYELKVNKITLADFKGKDGPLDQASGYAKHYSHPVHLVNFYLEGHRTPVQLDNIPENVTVVNIKHNAECTKYEISAPSYNRTVQVFAQLL